MELRQAADLARPFDRLVLPDGESTVQAKLLAEQGMLAPLRIPLSSYEDGSAFKLYALDVGLLGALAGLPAYAVLEGSRMVTEFKGSLTERYVMQELLLKGMTPRYWSADNATAEVDFAVSLGGQPVPIEVKAAENVRAQPTGRVR